MYVIDVRGTDLEYRLMATSLQGIVNRDYPKLYTIWESKKLTPTSSERWLEYYKSKGWISNYEYISLEDAIEQYKRYINGIVIYDTGMRDTINLAVTISGLENRLITNDYYSDFDVIDLRNQFSSKSEIYEYQLSLFNNCNKNEILMYPTNSTEQATIRSCLVDYAVSNKIASINLIATKDSELFSEYLSRMNTMARVLGYPPSGRYEIPTVRFISSHNCIGVLGSFLAPNFSVHSKIGSYTIRQYDIPKVAENKIYICFAMCDLGLTSMATHYYEAWESSDRGRIPLSWWFDTIITEYCPGIVNYYFETATDKDYFFVANGYGRITPSDFPKLDKYLEKLSEKINETGLRSLAFSDSIYNPDVTKQYANLPVNGIVHGFMNDIAIWQHNNIPIIEEPKQLKASTKSSLYTIIDNFIQAHPERPLIVPVYVLIAEFITIKDILEVASLLKAKYNEIEFVRLDELISIVSQLDLPETPPIEVKGKLPVNLIIAGALLSLVVLFVTRGR